MRMHRAEVRILKSTSLNPWLIGAQTITFLASGDVELALDAAKRRIYKTPLAKMPKGYESTGGTPEACALIGPSITLSDEARHSLAGNPEDWAGDWWFFLGIRTGRNIDQVIAELLAALRAGDVRAQRANGEPIDCGVWNNHVLMPHPPNVLEMVYRLDGPSSHDGESPQFFRDDVLRLRNRLATTSAKAGKDGRRKFSVQALRKEFEALEEDAKAAGTKLKLEETWKALQNRVSPDLPRAEVEALMLKLREDRRRKRGERD
jgi:hypothetical protein